MCLSVPSLFLPILFSLLSFVQLDSDACSPAELDAIAARETSLKDSLAEQRAKNSKLDGQIRALQNEPSDEELAKQLQQYKKQIDALNAKLARFKNDKNPVTKVRWENVQKESSAEDRRGVCVHDQLSTSVCL